MASPGDPIQLDYQLHDFSVDKFVKATIKADGVEISGSPILVPHISNGGHFYKDIMNLLFPSNIFEIQILFEVYADAGLITRLKRYGAGRDVYKLVTVSLDGSEIGDAVDEIKAVASSLRTIDGEITIENDIDNIEMILDPLEVLEFDLFVNEEEIEIELSVNEELDVFVESEDNDIILEILE